MRAAPAPACAPGARPRAARRPGAGRAPGSAGRSRAGARPPRPVRRPGSAPDVRPRARARAAIPRADDQHHTDDHRDRGGERPPEGSPRVDADDERGEPDDHARDAGRDPGERAPPGADEHRDGVRRIREAAAGAVASRAIQRCCSTSVCASRAMPDRRAAASGQTTTSPGHRPIATRSRPPRTTAAKAAVRDDIAPGRPAPTGSRWCVRHQRPGDAVHEHTEATRDRQHHEAAPHHVRVETERVGQTGGHTRHHAPLDGRVKSSPAQNTGARPREDDRAERGGAIRVRLRVIPDTGAETVSALWSTWTRMRPRRRPRRRPRPPRTELFGATAPMACSAVSRPESPVPTASTCSGACPLSSSRECYGSAFPRTSSRGSRSRPPTDRRCSHRDGATRR